MKSSCNTVSAKPSRSRTVRYKGNNDRFFQTLQRALDLSDFGHTINGFAVIRNIHPLRPGTVGSICPNRSSTPGAPKYGEAEDQIAPRLEAASIAIIVSGMFGIQPATRSPAPTPRFLSAWAKRLTAAYSSAKLILRSAPASEQKIRAVVLSRRRRSKFSAKFKRASGKNCAAWHFVGVGQERLAFVSNHHAEIPDG